MSQKSATQENVEERYTKQQIMQVAEQKFGLSRTEATAAFFDAPVTMTVKEAEAAVEKFKKKKVK